MDLLYNQQNRALGKNSPSTLSWRAISSMYSKITNRNVDPRIIYNEFTRKYENDKEVFDKVISRFDQNGVTLKTREDEIQGGAETGDAQKTVDSMAKRASAKLLSK